MKKNGLKKFVLVGGILVVTLGLLTGCGKKKEETKTYDKENEVVANTTNSQNPNEAIKIALKDENWRKNNILPEYFSNNDEYSKDLQKATKIYFAKMSDVDGNPVYLVNVTEGLAGGNYAKAVTYKDGKVVVSKNPATGEYSFLKADTTKNIITITNDPTNQTAVYKIDNNEFVKFAYSKLNYNDDTLYYYVNDENVSYGRFQDYIENCSELIIELTDENIDKYVTDEAKEKAEERAEEKTEEKTKTTITVGDTSKKYIGEIQTVDSNTQSPSFATTTYTVSVSDNAIEKIVAEVQYKAKDTVTITINNINVTSQDVAAGTSYVEFSFEGQTADGSKYTGTGTYSYSNVVDDSEIGLEMNYNEDIFNGVNISTGYRIRLGLGKALTNQPK